MIKNNKIINSAIDINPVENGNFEDRFLSQVEKAKFQEKEPVDIIKGRRPVVIKRKKNIAIFSFMMGVIGVSFFVIIIGFISFGLRSKGLVEVRGVRAINYINNAKINLQNKNFKLATTNLMSAKQEFEEAQYRIDELGGGSLDVFSHVPFLSKISSGKNVISLGNHLTEAVLHLSTTAELLLGVENPLEPGSNDKVSLTDIFIQAQKSIDLSKHALLEAERAGAKIKIKDLPKDYQQKIRFIKGFLPLINDSLDEFDRMEEIFLELFGHNGPRKYLIVFQNNQEMRATGGFIGSYGILETSQGKINKLKIEGIYNPDGQLKVDVIPPKPIQKISAGWSMHDANWFPDFPKSAEKISWFYEKTGGPTVDGVIAVTPVLLQKMLEVTGPLEMEKYDKTITSKNFIKEIQQQVEIDYKDTNKNIDHKNSILVDGETHGSDPKQILADLTPKLFAKFFELKDSRQATKAIKILLDSLGEKHILLNFSDHRIQKIIFNQGWSGEILQTEKDYLMVINSNINGYKTDGVISEKIKHQAEIKKDGSIIDTVTIVRRHNGGNTKYEWWNKVNSNYMRTYVPRGSKLILAEGQTREIDQVRLNYDKLGFQVDADIKKQEDSMDVNKNFGTRIYEEGGKTVFADWVYVSPQERVTVVYKYLLPFNVDITNGKDNRYSLLIQKQSGSVNSTIKSEIEFPFTWKTTWIEPESLKLDRRNGRLIFENILDSDQFIGAVFK